MVGRTRLIEVIGETDRLEEGKMRLKLEAKIINK